jgi:threonine dehydrogenase-like Zn-dependent dehydrogenase
MEEHAALPVPAGVKPEAAVYARMLAVGMSALVTTKARPPARVLVTGLGLVGLLTARIFETCGYNVLACEPIESRRKIAASCGVDALMAMPLDDASIIGQVDVVLECSGHEQAAMDGCRIARKGGEVVLIGVPWERRTGLTAHDLLHEVFRRYVNLRSGWEWELPLYPTEFRGGSIYGNLAAALRWLQEGRVKVSELHTVMSPKRAQQAYQMLRDGQCEKLTVAFDWNMIIMG